MTRGNKHSGCDSASVKKGLIRVTKIYSTIKALAGVLKDTTVVSSGDKDNGGESSSVKTALMEADKTYSTN